MTREGRYRLLLRRYPRAYRDARGEELLDVLLASARSRRCSFPAEAAAVVRHGLAVRRHRPASPASGRGARALLGACLVGLLAVLGAHHVL
ncbi:hypothetical protein LMJ43_37900, partial [Streptomyces rochei]|nr:hypothetical protein [Streptomyces rochei]